jgi:manganese/zinc/iron transport system permease protein
MDYIINVQILSVLTGIACALPGVFLVLRRMSLISDAIAHSVLLGIVLSFFIIKTLDSPLLSIGASITGVLLVVVIELIQKSNLIKEDAAIGIGFTAFFAIAIILITGFAENVHLDMDIVYAGDLSLSAFVQVEVFGFSIPVGFISMGIVLVFNLIFIGLFYKELKLSTFDPALSYTLGFSPAIINYALMGLVSFTSVEAFDLVGSILVVALMIVPAASAYLLVDKVSHMLIIAAILGGVSGISGYWVANQFNTNISASIAIVTGIIFMISFLFSPKRGFVSNIIQRKKQKKDFLILTIIFHLLQHEDTDRQRQESNPKTIHQHLNWSRDFTLNLLIEAEKRNLIREDDGILKLTPKGHKRAYECRVHPRKDHLKVKLQEANIKVKNQ